MKKSNFNVRRCAFTKIRYPKEELFRFTVLNDEIVYDQNQNLEGRGLYIYKSEKNLNLLRKTNIFLKTFHQPLNQK